MTAYQRQPFNKYFFFSNQDKYWEHLISVLQKYDVFLEEGNHLKVFLGDDLKGSSCRSLSR